MLDLVVGELVEVVVEVVVEEVVWLEKSQRWYSMGHLVLDQMVVLVIVNECYEDILIEG